MRGVLVPVCLLAVLSLASPLFADNAPPLGSLAKMPITEVTVFKDGNAFVLHAGKMPTNPAGNVLLDYLPSPVLGTFWPSSADPKVKLTAVTASQRRVMVDRTALSIRELLEANPGADVVIKELPDAANVTGAEYAATIAGFPQRTVDELEATSPPNSAPRLPEKGALILLKTGTGTKAVDIGRIQNVTFKNPPKTMDGNEELRHLLTLKLQWPDNKPQPQADVAMVYLQKGIRWIPNYKISIDGSGNAVFQLQATLINELYDLQDVTANLVVGVPTFDFGDLQDPIGLQQAVAQLSNYFRNDNNNNGRTFNNYLSNSMMTQVAMQTANPNPGQPGAGGGGGDLGPDLGGSQKNEDLYVFTVNHITLKKGDRMVVPINEFKLAYKDVYILDIPFSPPPEIWRAFDSSRQAELARLYNAPKAIHNLRLTNSTAAPITTAPALILKDNKIIAQTTTLYTPAGGQLDLRLTPALDITVKKTDRETKRDPRAETWNGNPITRIDLAGTIALANLGATKADLEIRRSVLGEADKADNEGKIEMLNPFEDRSFLPASADSSQPFWWSWYNWPEWWSRFNGIGSISWKTTLEPGKNITFSYSWHYYWR